MDALQSKSKLTVSQKNAKQAKVNGGEQSGKCCESSYNGKIGEVCIDDS